MPPTNPRRRRELADAAVELLAADGVHGLTHRAVEKRAQVPSGTASNYFRSREALLVAAAERIVELHLADMEASTAPDTGSAPLDLDGLVDMLTASLLVAATTQRDRYLAIFELLLESRRRPALASALTGLGETSVALTVALHAALGLNSSPEAISTLVTLYGGALFALVTLPRDQVTEPGARAVAEAMVRGVLER